MVMNYCRLSIIDENLDEMIFVMNNIEEAVYFVENYVKSLRNIDDVAQAYSRIFVKDKEKGRYI